MFLGHNIHSIKYCHYILFHNAYPIFSEDAILKSEERRNQHWSLFKWETFEYRQVWWEDKKGPAFHSCWVYSKNNYDTAVPCLCEVTPCSARSQCGIYHWSYLQPCIATLSASQWWPLVSGVTNGLSTFLANYKSLFSIRHLSNSVTKTEI